jgi:uncharacterized protein YndB with AHSA1/START domain
MSSDRIERKVILGAAPEIVWRAISDSQAFGRWFGVKFDGPFVADQPMVGHITPTEVDAEVAAAQKDYAGMPFKLTVEAVEPERLFSFRWHPFAIDPDRDYSAEPMTLVEFNLRPFDVGTELTIVESGFDQIPLDRREEAFEMNTHGWEAQARLISNYLESRSRP